MFYDVSGVFSIWEDKKGKHNRSTATLLKLCNFTLCALFLVQWLFFLLVVFCFYSFDSFWLIEAEKLHDETTLVEK